MANFDVPFDIEIWQHGYKEISFFENRALNEIVTTEIQHIFELVQATKMKTLIESLINIKRILSRLNMLIESASAQILIAKCKQQEIEDIFDIFSFKLYTFP